eukprot:907480_1
MKNLLLYLTILFTLLAVSSADEDCDDGTWEGEEAVNDVYDYECSNVLERDFNRQVDRKTKKLLRRERTWHDRVFNKCFRKAVEKRLREVGNECLDDPYAADDCDELGRAAARIIVQDSGLCPSSASKDSLTSSIKQFQRACRSAAKDECESSIRDELDDCGADSSLRTARPLKRKCKEEIRSLTRGMLR